MSEQAVGAALLQDSANAKLIVDKLRTEAEKCAVLHKRAREQRRRERKRERKRARSEQARKRKRQPTRSEQANQGKPTKWRARAPLSSHD